MIKEISLKGMKVCIAIPCYDGVIPVETATQLAKLAIRLSEMGVSIGFISERNNGLIDVVRNTLAKRFMEETDYDKVLFLDNDIVFDADDAIRLLAWSTIHKVVGSTYPIKRDHPKGFFVQPLDPKLPLDENGLIETKGFGFGFVVIDRSVFETMKPHTEVYKMDGEFVRYFQTGVVDGHYRGEDIWFFNRWHEEFGGKVMLDPWISLKHVGKKYYDYKFKDILNDLSN